MKLSDTKQKAGMFRYCQRGTVGICGTHDLRRLRDGRSIRTVSALLMQLVQSSSHRVRVSAVGIDKKRRQQQALRRQDSSQSMSASESRFLNDIDEEVRVTSHISSAL